MDSNNQEKSSDFEVSWRNKFTQSEESISIQSLMQNNGYHSSELRNVVSTSHTDSVVVEVSVLEWECPTEIKFTPFRFGFNLLITSTSQIEYAYEGEEITRDCKEGNIYFMFPGREVTTRISPGRMSTVTCSFDAEFVKRVLGPVEVAPTQLKQVLGDIRSPIISNLLLRLMQETIYPGPLNNAVLNIFGEAILVEFAHRLKSHPNINLSMSQLTARHFEKIQLYLLDLAGKAPSVVELASICGFSERYFAKLFKERMGLTISQYIKAVRISRAKHLLSFSELSLKEIAYQLGYSSAANFSSAFASSAGLSPSEYRRAYSDL